MEIAFFDRGPLDTQQLITGGYWSAYWYNGFVYGAEIARGMDVFRLKPSAHVSQNEIDAAVMVRMDEFNAQQQPRIVWPPTAAVARAYLDQLTRSRGIRAERAAAVKTALDRAEALRTSGEERAAGVATQLEALATQLENDASAATATDAPRLRSLGATLRGRAARLR